MKNQMKDFSRFLRSGILLLVLASQVLVGCAPAVTPVQPTAAPAQATAIPAQPTKAAAAAPVTLVTGNHLTREEWHAALDKILADYTKENPSITVQQQSTAYKDLAARVATDRMADNPPDMYQLPAWWTGDLVSSDNLAEVPADIVADIKANYPPGVLEAVTWDGKIRGVPLDYNPTVMFYNKKMLAEAGYTKPPETLDQLREYAVKLTKKDASGKTIQYGYSEWVGSLNSEYLPFVSLLYSNGGDVVDLTKKEATFNSKVGVDILTLQTDLIKAGAFSPDLTYTDWYTNRVAISILPTFVRSYLVSYNDPNNFGSAPVPHGAGLKSGAVMYSWFYVVNKRSKHAAEAWDFIRWFTLKSPAAGKATRSSQYYYDNTSVIPGRKADLEVMKPLYFSSDVYPAFIDAMSYAKSPPPIPHYEEMILAVNTALEGAWTGKKSPKDALDEAAAKVNALLKAP